MDGDIVDALDLIVARKHYTQRIRHRAFALAARWRRAR